MKGETKALTFPIQALIRIRSSEEAKAVLLDALKQYEPMDHRTTQAKVAIIDALGELMDTEEAEALLPYLNDHHDDVQASVIEVIEHRSPPAAAEALAQVCGSELHSGRIKRMSARTLAELGLPVRSAYEAFDPELKDAFLLGKKGQLVPRKARPES